MNPELVFYVQLLVIFGLDMVVGDPRLLPHPVRFIGYLCSWLETLARTLLNFLSERIQGIAACILVIGSSLLSLWLFFSALDLVAIHASIAGAGIICYFCMAAGDLVKHSARVQKHLEQGDMGPARDAVAMMVGRDTGQLDETGISRACIESVSENLVDGITAPLFWALIAALAAPVMNSSYIICASCGFFAYKAVNTMDSMWGYKNKRYIDFGSCAARVDDFCNFVPARISGLCVVAAARLTGYDGGRAQRIFFQDRLKSSSPNSAHTEAAVAGALGIRLGGPASYFGQTTLKPYLGEGLRQAAASDIQRANRLILWSAALFFLAGIGAHWITITTLQ